MHWYKRNIGDYAKKAARLSMLQHGAYTNLLDACYDRERFPTEDEALNWTWASNPEEEQAVLFVLKRFFDLQEDGTYVQHRVAEELRAYRDKQRKAQLVALYREHCKRERDAGRTPPKYDSWIKEHESCGGGHEPCTTSARPDQDRAPNQEPVTNNQEPVTSITTAASSELQGAQSGSNEKEIFIHLPTNRVNTTGETYPVTVDEVRKYEDIYTGLDVENEFKRMAAWITANPSKRKTLKGMPRFINGWLSNNLDKGKTNGTDPGGAAAAQRPESNHAKITRLCIEAAR